MKKPGSVHAPDPLYAGFALCLPPGQDFKARDSLSDDPAEAGEVVDCKDCLLQLSQQPQYANFLIAKGIDARGKQKLPEKKAE